jgi:hypothetical protein
MGSHMPSSGVIAALAKTAVSKQKASTIFFIFFEINRFD